MSELLVNQLTAAIICFARISGCFLLLPGFSSARIPQPIRMIFVLWLTIAMFSLMPNSFVDSGSQTIWSLGRLLVSETIVGSMLGIGVRYYMLSISFMMNAASSAIGFNSQFAPAVFDNDMEPALASIISSATLLALFSMDFHHAIIRALVDSFALVPIGSKLEFSAIASNITSSLRDSFLIVFRISSPFLAYALIVNIFIAILNKIVPNLPIYFVLTPLVLIGGLFLFYNLFPVIIPLAAQGHLQKILIYE